MAEFQYGHALPPTGWFDRATFQVFRGVWQERRPFIMARVREQPCPDPPPLYQLGYLVESEEHADRLTRLATLPRGLRPIRNAAIGMAGRVPAVRRALAMRLSGLVYR